jgi:hypothetical protein
MTTTQPTPFQADFDAKPFEQKVTCLRSWAADNHNRYHEAMNWMFQRDLDEWNQAISLTRHCFRV